MDPREAAAPPSRFARAACRADDRMRAAPFFARLQPRALEIENLHFESRGADGNFAADLARADDADRAAVQAARSGNARPIRARHMSAVERLVGGKIRSGKLRDAAEPGDAMDAPRDLAKMTASGHSACRSGSTAMGAACKGQ